MTYILIFFASCINLYMSHPQCLDYRAPFKPNKPLQFCEEYSSYSCCTLKKDSDLSVNYRYALNFEDDGLKHNCSDFMKIILCLECHPYAAHVFDAEGFPGNEVYNKRSVNFPGLCKKYCIKMFSLCRSVLLKVVQTDGFYHFTKNASVEDFCSWAVIPDRNYCYPNVKDVDKETSGIRKDSDSTVTLCVKRYQSYFANALVAVHSNDGTHRLFVGEQRGLIHVVDHTGKKLNETFLNITDRVVNSGSQWDERGLLGLVFHPRYKSNGRFYVYYSTDRGTYYSNYSEYQWHWRVPHRIRLSEFTVDPDRPNKADESSELVLLEVDQPEANHNGGMLTFGNDGYLYMFVGDGGGSGDDHGSYGNSLNMSTLLGKILRINIDSDSKLFSIPRDNPFVGISNTRPEIYAYGARNMWRCSVDRGDQVTGIGKGRMFCGDVGQNEFEEIDIIKKGANYGWRAFEGHSCFDKKLCRKYFKNLEFPIITYGHHIGRSVVGGYVYRGCNSPNMAGKYFYADTMNGRMFMAEEVDNKWISKEILMGNSSICNEGLSSHYLKHILSFGENEFGDILLLGSFNTYPLRYNGYIYQLVDPQLRGDPEQCVVTKRKVKPLKQIKRRTIYKKLKGLLPPCVDLKTICIKYFQPSNGRKALLSCQYYSAYSKRYCAKSCKYC